VFAVPPNTVATLATHAGAHPVRIAREFARDRSRWRHLLRYDYQSRWYALAERTDEHEVWLMSWLPGQATGVHDHGGATGAFTIVSGTLTERVLRADPVELPPPVHTLEPGQSRVFGPNYVHEVSNEGGDPAVSVHVYQRRRLPLRHYHVNANTGLSPVDPA
jgi:predicted metal-dependent enzyme (double-stranded beta helix superfamily)